MDKKHEFKYNTLTCVCGKTFLSPASLCGHMGRCKQYIGEDRYAEEARKRAHPHKHKPSGLPAWNRGLTKDTDARVAKISLSLKSLNRNGRGSTPEIEAERKAKLSEIAKSRNFGGYQPGSGHGRKGRYKGIWCDSTWELAYVIFNIDHAIPFERNFDAFEYEYKGTIHKYIPDFKQGDSYIEIKGYERPIDKIKYTAVSNLQVLYEEDMTEYLEYVKNTYGGDFARMYDAK